MGPYDSKKEAREDMLETKRHYIREAKWHQRWAEKQKPVKLDGDARNDIRELCVEFGVPIVFVARMYKIEQERVRRLLA